MKATAPSLPVSAAVSDKSLVAVLADLVKARLTFLVLVTTFVGFFMGSSSGIETVLMLNALAGTALVACGASALNQFLEREHDALMQRTESRPLPSGRLHPETVLLFGVITSVVGLMYLAFAVNPLTALLGAITLGSYVFVYTPLKRITTLNTAIGAIPGALPPLMGWTAARGEVSIEGWTLFAILFFWQLPHFLAIAWVYRDEYAKAGFAMLPVFDPGGDRTARQAISHTLGLLPVSLTPFLFKMVGVGYVFGALILGVIFLICAIRFARALTLVRAKQLFFFSIIYLPLLLGLMMATRK